MISYQSQYYCELPLAIGTRLMSDGVESYIAAREPYKAGKGSEIIRWFYSVKPVDPNHKFWADEQIANPHDCLRGIFECCQN